MASSVFISWSGTVGRQVALALDEFLPVFIHSVEPWVSPVAISVGQRWLTELAQVLDACDFGIICITPDSLHSAWLLFEAGALGKKFADSRVCPILVGVERHELPDCINQFQSVSADRAGLFQLVTSLKKCLGPPRLSDQQLERNFNAFWPLLEERLALASEQLAEQRESRISVIHGALQRTKQIVADLEFLRDSRSAFGEAKIVRYSGFLSTFAFSKEEFDRWRDEMRAEKLVNPRSTGLEYIDALQDEHDRMLDIAKQEHCLIKCVITPPTLNWQSTDPESAAAAEQSKQRLNRLKEFLEGSDDALNNIEWAISPYLQPNSKRPVHPCCVV